MARASTGKGAPGLPGAPPGRNSTSGYEGSNPPAAGPQLNARRRKGAVPRPLGPQLDTQGKGAVSRADAHGYAPAGPVLTAKAEGLPAGTRGPGP